MLRPLRDYLVVEVAERVKSDVLLVIADEKPNTGTVVATGPGRRDKRGQLRPLDVRVGDRVRYGSAENYLSFREHAENGRRYLLLQEADVCWIDEPRASAAGSG